MNVVPSTRLLGWTAAVLPVAALAGPLPALAAGAWLLGAVLAVLALGDLLLSLRTVAAPAATLPDVIRLAKDREGEFRVVLRRAPGGPRRVRFGLGLPTDFEQPQSVVDVRWPAEADAVAVPWRCTARRRGRFAAGPVCCETDSRWGFWQLRTRRPARSEVRVYPNLFTERRQLAAIFLSRGQFGAKLQRTVGRGREFEKLRDYLPGDGLEDVHWKATAKRGRPITKMFQAERTQEIYLVLDCSRLSDRRVEHDGRRVTALERQITAALVLLLAAERQGDRFGLVVHSDRVEVFLRAGTGEKHFGACREAVHGLEPAEVTPDFGELFTFLRLRLRQRALLFFLTDLSDPVQAEEFARHVGIVARQHLVLAGMLRPPGTAPLFAGGEVASADEIYERLGGHLRWRESREVSDLLRRRGATAVLLENETLAAQLVAQYMRVKQRQLL